jgi:hypothetical protein
MYVDPITYIIIFGAIVVSFLWLRDTRIYARTGLTRYREVAYQGSILTALGWFSVAIAGLSDAIFLYLSCGLIFLVLYHQSRNPQGDIWKGDESAWQRFTGEAPRKKHQRQP